MCPSIRKKRVSEELALKIRPLSSIPIPFYFYPSSSSSFSSFLFSPSFVPSLLFYIYVYIFRFSFASRRNHTDTCPASNFEEKRELSHSRIRNGPAIGQPWDTYRGDRVDQIEITRRCRDQFPWMGFPFRLS